MRGIPANPRGPPTMDRCRSTVTRRSSCAPRSWARPTGSSRCSPAARQGPRGRQGRAAHRSRLGARVEPFMLIDVQLYEGRSLDIVTQAETIGPYGDAIARDYAALHRRRRRCSRPPSGSPRSASRRVQLFLLLAGGLRTPRRAASTTPGSCSTPSCCGRCPSPAGRRASSTARAAGPPARTAPSPWRRAGRLPGVPAARVGRAAPGDPRAARGAAVRRLGGRRRQRRRASARGQRPGRRPTCSGTSSAGTLAAAWMRAGDAARPFAAPERRAATGAAPREHCPAARRDRHGRQRPLGQRPRPAPDEGPRGGRGSPARRRRRGDRDRRDPRVGVRLLHRELAALARRGALPHGVQPRRHPPPPRPAARVGRAGALGRPAAAAVAQRHRRARDRRGAHPRTTTVSP